MVSYTGVDGSIKVENCSSKSDLITVVSEFSGSSAHTDVLFVSPNGDNSDGLTWSTAYNTLQTACEIATNNSYNWLINIAPGHYVETDPTPTYSGNINLSAVDPHSVIVTNTVCATHVLEFTGLVYLKNICVTCADAQDGIIYNRSNHGGLFDTVHIDATAVTGAQSAITFKGGGNFAQVINCFIEGNVLYTTGIDVVNWSKSEIHAIRIGKSIKGIHITAGNAWFLYGKINLNFNTTAIEIESGVTSTRIVDVYYNGNTTNVIDNGTGTIITRGSQTLDREVTKIFPITTSTGTEVTTGTANVWGSYAEIDDGSSFTSAFKITGIYIANPSDADDEYFVEIATGAAASELSLSQTGFTGGNARSNVGTHLKSGWLAPDTRISARGMSSSGADTFDVWLEYVCINC